MAKKKTTKTAADKALPDSAGSRGRGSRYYMQGYVTACAELVRRYDQPTIAEDLLKCFGPIDWSRIADYDKEALVDSIPESVEDSGGE